MVKVVYTPQQKAAKIEQDATKKARDLGRSISPSEYKEIVNSYNPPAQQSTTPTTAASNTKQAYYYDLDTGEVYSRVEGSGQTPVKDTTTLVSRGKVIASGGYVSNSGRNLTPNTVHFDQSNIIKLPEQVQLKENIPQKINNILSLPNQIYTQAVYQKLNAYARTGKQDMFNNRHYNNLMPYQQRGTANINMITPLTDDELLNLPLGAGEEEYIRRTNKLIEENQTVIQEQTIKDISKKYEEDYNQKYAELQDQVNKGEMQEDLAQSLLDSYNNKLQSEFYKEVVESNQEPIAEAQLGLANRINQARDKRLFSDVAIETTPTILTGAAFGLGAALSKTVAYAGGASMALSIAKEAPSIYSSTLRKDYRSITSFAASFGATIVGAKFGSSLVKKTPTASQGSLAFIGSIRGNKGKFASEELQGKRPNKTFSNVKTTSEGLYSGKTTNIIRLTSHDSNIIKSKSGGKTTEIGEVTLNKPLSNSSSITFSKPIENAQAYISEGSNVVISDTLVNENIAGVIKPISSKKPTPIINKNKGLIIISQIGNSNFYQIAISPKPALRIYKSGKTSIVAKQSSFTIRGLVSEGAEDINIARTAKGRPSKLFRDIKEPEQQTQTIVNPVNLIQGQQNLGSFKTKSSSSSIADVIPVSQLIEQSKSQTQSSFYGKGMYERADSIFGYNINRSSSENKPSYQKIKSEQGELFKFDNKDIIGYKNKSQQNTKEKSSYSFGFSNSSGNKTNETQDTFISESLGESFKFKSEQKQEPQQRTSQRFTFGIRPISPTRPEQPRRNKITNFGTDFEEERNKTETGYLGFVKFRGKYKQVTNKPVSKSSALKIGLDIADRTLARSVKVVPTKTKIKKGSGSALGNLYKFRTFQQRNNKKIGLTNTYIEKSRYSLEKGESRQLRSKRSFNVFHL